MENFSAVLIPAVLTVFLVRLLALPLKLSWKLLTHSACGLVCLWLLNAVSPFTGIQLPVNAVTVLIAGTLGVPGMAVMAILQKMP